MAAVLISTRRAERGIMECERTLGLNPSLASAHAMLGELNVNILQRHRQQRTRPAGVARRRLRGPTERPPISGS